MARSAGFKVHSSATYVYITFILHVLGKFSFPKSVLSTDFYHPSDMQVYNFYNLEGTCKFVNLN